MAIFKGNNNNKCWQDAANRNPYIVLVEMQNSAIPMESSLEIPQKAKGKTSR
jgi:hypothetical protein